MTLLSLFHSQERFAIAHSYSEKIKFLKQKIMFFFDKKLIFYKEMSIFNQFLPNSELWPAGVVHMCTPELFDIGVRKVSSEVLPAQTV